MPMHGFEDAINDLTGHIREGTFVPFLGSEASRLWLKDQGERNLISARFLALKNSLGSSDNQDREGDLKYLQNLAKVYDIKAEAVGDLGEYDFDEEAPMERHLANLRYYVVKLSSGLVKLFGQQMSAERPCVENVWSYRVPVGERQEDLKHILEYCVGALNACRDCQRLGDTSKERDAMAAKMEIFDPALIYAKLLIITGHFVKSLGASGIKILDDHYARLLSITNSASGPDISEDVTLKELAWLEDLVWHTLRFDIPESLNMDEMTFRFSLQTFESLSEKEVLQVVTERGLKEEPQICLKRWVEFQEHEKKPPSEFYDDLAAALWHKYEVYAMNLKSPGYYKSMRLPIAFTTNFDRSIERGLRHLGKDYHVVFPLSTVYRNRGQKGPEAESDVATEHSDPLDIAWAFRTYTCDDNNYGWETIRCPKGEGEVFKEVKGPIIVKLHGSPAEHLLDQGKIADPESYKISHFIVLSEYDYLRTAVQNSDHVVRVFPEFIEGQLASGGDWWFLGYSLDDWFTHLRIYQYLSFPSEAEPRTAQAIDPDYDDFRATVMHSLGVRRMATDLHAVGHVLSDMAEIRKIKKEAGIR